MIARRRRRSTSAVISEHSVDLPRMRLVYYPIDFAAAQPDGPAIDGVFPSPYRYLKVYVEMLTFGPNEPYNHGETNTIHH